MPLDAGTAPGLMAAHEVSSAKNSAACVQWILPEGYGRGIQITDPEDSDHSLSLSQWMMLAFTRYANVIYCIFLSFVQSHYHHSLLVLGKYQHEKSDPASTSATSRAVVRAQGRERCRRVLPSSTAIHRVAARRTHMLTSSATYLDLYKQTFWHHNLWWVHDQRSYRNIYRFSVELYLTYFIKRCPR